MNNEAANFYFGNVLNASEDAWNETVDVNLKSYFFMSLWAAKMMAEKSGGGSIINVASINGIRPAPMQGIYSITKAGFIALTKSFAKEIAAFNIRVNAILPGLTDTKFSSVMTQNEELMEKGLLPQIPCTGPANPTRWPLRFFTLPQKNHPNMKGALLVTDGGMLA